MNIHITDIDLVNRLKESTIFRATIGSHMYGTNDSGSDIDYLHIYTTSENELMSVIKTNNQLQYKEGNVDYLFVSLHTFIGNILNGDSTINFEVVNSKQLIGSELEWLYDIRHYFNTFTIIKSYLGFARRDIRHYNRYFGRDKTKRLRHIIRGYLYSRHILDNNWDFDEVNSILRSIDISDETILKDYKQKIDLMRFELSDKFNSSEFKLAQKIRVDDGVDLSNKLIDFCNSDYFKIKQSKLDNFDLYDYINSYENWVSY